MNKERVAEQPDQCSMQLRTQHSSVAFFRPSLNPLTSTIFESPFDINYQIRLFTPKTFMFAREGMTIDSKEVFFFFSDFLDFIASLSRVIL